MSDKFKDRARKYGVYGRSQDRDPEHEGHQQQQVEGATTQPNVHLLNQENPTYHPAAPPPPPPPPPAHGATFGPFQENVVHHQPTPMHQGPVNTRPIPFKKPLGRRFVREASSDDYYLPIGKKGNVNSSRPRKRGHGRRQGNGKGSVRFTFQADEDEYVSCMSTDSPTRTNDTDEDPTYDIDEEEECKTGSITKSSRKRPGDDQDPPGLAKFQKTVGSNSTSRRSMFVK